MKILIITSHPDDLEMSMGGTLAKLREKMRLDQDMLDVGEPWDSPDKIEVHVFSDSTTVKGNDGISEELSKSIHGVYGLDCNVYGYTTMYFRERYQAIRDDIFRIKQEFHPDVVYCKSPRSLHPDHQVIGEACESIFLESTIYAMEGIRDGHNLKINKWVDINENHLDTKIAAILCYKSQSKRAYFDIDIIESWARFRGAQVGLQLAEGFEVIREVSK